MNKRSYYEILGVPPHVGSGQIQAAYRFTRALYAGEGLATYGFIDADERGRMLALVDEAYAALSNPNGRRDYDAHLSASAPEAQATAALASPDPEQTPSTTPLPVAAPCPQVESGAALQVPENVSGKTLRELRRARGLSVEQIAALSKIGTRFLSALEDDRHEILPGRVFARGFLIEYARAVHVSESELVDRYLRHWHGR